MWFSASIVIRIFGVFTLAKLHHAQFWDSLSRQLQRRGPDYIERCTFRNKPLSVGDNVILPAQFPPLPYQVEDVPQDEPLVKVSDEDMKDVSDIAHVLKVSDQVRVQ